MNKNIYWTPNNNDVTTFMKTYFTSFDESLDYSKWHYVKGFTKNCQYKSNEYYEDVRLMKKLHDNIMQFQKTYYPRLNIKEHERIKLSKKPTIFLYWHQGKNNLPKLQQLCYDRLIQKCSNDYNIMLLDNSDVENYINISSFIKTAMLEKRMWLQHYVDYIRICLLAKYEAIWFDATIFVRDNLKDVNFNYDFWSIKCKDMFADTWAKDVIPEMNNCQIYAMSGKSNYFYNAMKQLIEFHFKHFKIAYSYYMMYYIAEYLYEIDDTIKLQFDNLTYNNEHVECFANNRSLTIDDFKRLWQTNTSTHIFKLLKFKNEDSSDTAYNVYQFFKTILESGE